MLADCARCAGERAWRWTGARWRCVQCSVERPPSADVDVDGIRTPAGGGGFHLEIACPFCASIEAERDGREWLCTGCRRTLAVEVLAAPPAPAPRQPPRQPIWRREDLRRMRKKKADVGRPTFIADAQPRRKVRVA